MGVPKEIAEAILAFRKAIKPMAHDANNPHDNYDYVSIDKYYAEVGRTATEVGLVWRTRELSFDMLDNMGRSRDRTYVKCVFGYDLMANGAEAEEYMRVTIISPMAGPQTTGQLYSYADKVMMRVLGCVVTGEKDADAIKQEVIESAPMVVPPAPKVVPLALPVPNNVLPMHNKDTGEILDKDLDLDDLTPKGVEEMAEKDLISRERDGLPMIDTRKIAAGPAIGIIEGIFSRFLPGCKTQPQLRDFYAENLAAIEKVKQYDPMAYDRIKGLFTKQKQAITQ